MHDFAVKYDPDKDTAEDLSARIIYSLFVRPLKLKKPRIIFISGDSGEGKSVGAIRLQELLCKIQGIDINKHFKDMNVFTPLEYPHKLDAILNDTKLKKVNIICMHEAREIIKAKQWHNFLTQSIADVNAMSRSIKRICFIIISQFIRDITSDVRYTLNYYCKMQRVGGVSKMYVFRIWKDDKDLEKPKLKKRKIRGKLILPNGRRRMYCPEYLIINKPDEKLLTIFDELDTQSKAKIIRKKINTLIKEMEKDLTDENKKILAMVEWYKQHPAELDRIGKVKRKKFILNDNFNHIHDLVPQERDEFVKLLQKELETQQLIQTEGDNAGQHDTSARL